MQASINVDVKHNVGTVAWVTNHLSGIELKISTLEGAPSVSYRAKWEEITPKVGEQVRQKWYTLCAVQTSKNMDLGMSMKLENMLKNEIYYLHPIEKQFGERWGMFNYLTKAAYKVVEDFIFAVVEKFDEYLESDQGEVQFKIELIKK